MGSTDDRAEWFYILIANSKSNYLELCPAEIKELLQFAAASSLLEYEDVYQQISLICQTLIFSTAKNQRIIIFYTAIRIVRWLWKSRLIQLAYYKRLSMDPDHVVSDRIIEYELDSAENSMYMMVNYDGSEKRLPVSGAQWLLEPNDRVSIYLKYIVYVKYMLELRHKDVLNTLETYQHILSNEELKMQRLLNGDLDAQNQQSE